MSTATLTTIGTSVQAKLGYESFTIGKFTFERDEYFAHIVYPGNRHIMPIEAFLRALMRDIAWGFFYGTVNFDNVFGTINHYGTVEMYIGLNNFAYRNSHREYVETFQSKELKKTFEAILANWTNEGFDPFAAPEETGDAYGPKHGDNLKAIQRERLASKRMLGLPGDLKLRSDAAGQPINRQFQDVPQDQPEIHAKAGFEGEVHAVNLFSYLSRSDVTWNPSVVSVVQDSLLCPTTEEHILPIIHGNDRVEWFVQFSDEIIWDIEDKDTGGPVCKVTMKAGDVSAMPANIRHRGYSPKRSMLLVWENNDGTLPHRHASGELKPYPVEF
jgi:hydroquinone 1,2-dioxygenase large subunit-like protein